MELGLKGKSALITGGSHGIGREIAIGLAREGCNIAILDANRFSREGFDDATESLGASYGRCGAKSHGWIDA